MKKYFATALFALAVFIPHLAFAAPVLVVHTASVGPGSAAGANSATTPNVDTTGANLFIVKVSWYGGTTAHGTLSDSSSNTYTPLTEYKESVLPMSTQLFYSFNPTTAPSQSFVYSGTQTFANVQVQAWSGFSASPFDVENGATMGNINNTTIQPGNLTPSQSNCLFVSGLGHENNSSGAISINSSFTISDDVPYVAGNSEGGTMAYKLSTTGTAENPTWNFTTAVTSSQADIACFKYTSASSFTSFIVKLGTAFSVMLGTAFKTN